MKLLKPASLSCIRKHTVPQLRRANRLDRHFSYSPMIRLRTSELKPDQLTWFKADASRLWSDIHATAQWGAAYPYGEQSVQTGLSRLSLSSTDRQARDWFCETARSLSCTVQVDEIGNTFAVRPGLKNDVPPTVVGSHLDSQPMGGRFDGVLGVCAGIEMLRVLEENHIETEGPVGVVNWTNEEGARFPASMMGSGVWAGRLDLDHTYALHDVCTGDLHPKTVLEELNRIGYRGSVPANWNKGVRLGAHFELHIEQGPYLQDTGQNIGAVQGVQAYKWFEVTVVGRSAHTGATGFKYRADALYWASQIISNIRGLAEKIGGLASVGIIKSEPQSVNTVPGKVVFSLDIRHAEDQKLANLVETITTYIKDKEIQSGEDNAPGVKISVQETFHSPGTNFDKEAIQCIEDGALALLEPNSNSESTHPNIPPVRRMFSGAGHDSVNTQLRCPTAMVFVPCKNGVSHHPEEWCSKEDCAMGASVLMQAVMRYDRLRFEKGHFDD